VNIDFDDQRILDIFKEIGNIGAGNALTSLASILGKKVDMAVPQAKMVSFNEFSEIMGGSDNIIAGFLINISGDLNGYMMLVESLEEAKYMANILNGSKEEKTGGQVEFSEMDISALSEITNILSGSYISALSGLTEFKMNSSVPYWAIDMAAAIISVPAMVYGEIGDHILLVDASFRYEGKKVGGSLLLILDYDSYEKMLTKLLNI